MSDLKLFLPPWKSIKFSKQTTLALFSHSKYFRSIFKNKNQGDPIAHSSPTDLFPQKKI
jgi:hypothetical protein